MDWERHVVVSAPTTELLRALLQSDPQARPRSANAVQRHIARIRGGRVDRPFEGAALSPAVLPSPPRTGRRMPVAVAPARVPSVFESFPPLEDTALVPRRRGLLDQAPVAQGVGASPARVVPRRKGPGLVKGCFFTLLLYGILALVALVLLLVFAKSGPVLVGF